jgi:type 1 glutamine amidotransferase
MIRRLVLSVAVVLGFALAAGADDKPKRVLFVTHSGGFIHDSVGVAEDVLTELGPKNGFTVTTWRYTGDPAAKVKVKPKGGGSEVEVSALEKYSTEFRARTGKPVDKEHMGRINKESLKNFDCVFFFTTGTGSKMNNVGPLTDDELKDLREWVKAGGCLVGTHCATDTLYNTPYGDLIGGVFKIHPQGLQNVKLKCEDPKHPAAAGLEDGMMYTDEIYIFKDDSADRSKIHVIWSIEKGQFDQYAKTAKADNSRKDGDYVISWCKDEGKGKVFYTSLGHQQKVWKDEKFQKHLLGGMNWAMGRAAGSATPATPTKAID